MSTRDRFHSWAKGFAPRMTSVHLNALRPNGSWRPFGSHAQRNAMLQHVKRVWADLSEPMRRALAGPGGKSSTVDALLRRQLMMQIWVLKSSKICITPYGEAVLEVGKKTGWS